MGFEFLLLGTAKRYRYHDDEFVAARRQLRPRAYSPDKDENVGIKGRVESKADKGAAAANEPHSGRVCLHGWQLRAAETHLDAGDWPLA